MMKTVLAIALVFFLIMLGCQDSTKTTEETSKPASKELKTYAQTTELPDGLHTPDLVETSIGTMKFIDGAPLPETADLVYENLDRMRGVDVFLKCMPAASVRQLIVGPESLGTNHYNKVLIYDKLMDS